MGNHHPSSQLLPFIERRLPLQDRARLESHLSSCPDCRAELDDLRRLTHALSAAPRALDALPSRRALNWAAMGGRLVGATSRRDMSHWHPAFALALVVVVVMVSASLFVSPLQGNALAASGPALAVIQTPAAPAGLTGVPDKHTVTAAADSTATHSLGQGQTPAPIPNP